MYFCEAFLWREADRKWVLVSVFYNIYGKLQEKTLFINAFEYFCHTLFSYMKKIKKPRGLGL